MLRLSLPLRLLVLYGLTPRGRVVIEPLALSVLPRSSDTSRVLLFLMAAPVVRLAYAHLITGVVIDL